MPRALERPVIPPPAADAAAFRLLSLPAIEPTALAAGPASEPRAPKAEDTDSRTPPPPWTASFASETAAPRSPRVLAADVTPDETLTAPMAVATATIAGSTASRFCDIASNAPPTSSATSLTPSSEALRRSAAPLAESQESPTPERSSTTRDALSITLLRASPTACAASPNAWTVPFSAIASTSAWTQPATGCTTALTKPMAPSSAWSAPSRTCAAAPDSTNLLPSPAREPTTAPADSEIPWR